MGPVEGAPWLGATVAEVTAGPVVAAGRMREEGAAEAGGAESVEVAAAEGREEERMQGWRDACAGVGCAACGHRKM